MPPGTAAELGRAIMEAHDALLKILKPHIREHNWTRLTRVLGFFADASFLTAFLADGAYAGERERRRKARKREERTAERHGTSVAPPTTAAI